MLGHGAGFFLVFDKGLTTAVLGGIAAFLGAWARGLTRRSRILLLVVGFAAMAVFVTHRTPLGEAMLNWYLD